METDSQERRLTAESRYRARKAALDGVTLSPQLAGMMNRYGLDNLEIYKTSEFDLNDEAKKTECITKSITDKKITVVIRESDGWIMWDSKPPSNLVLPTPPKHTH